MTVTINGIFKTPALRDLALTVRGNVSTVDVAIFAVLC
jgi:hypothetical protein